MKKLLFQLWGALPIPLRLRRGLVWFATDKFLVGVIAAVLDSDGKILLFKHTYRGKTFPWGPPSGWLKPGEDPARAIIREIHEETGLAARVTRPLFTESAERANRVDIVYLCEITGGVFKPSTEVSEIAYFERDKLPNMLESQYDMIYRIFEAAAFHRL